MKMLFALLFCLCAVCVGCGKNEPCKDGKCEGKCCTECKCCDGEDCTCVKGECKCSCDKCKCC